MSKKFTVSNPPHFRSADSLARRALADGVALFPFILIRFFQEPLHALRVFSLIFSGGFLAILFSALTLHRKKIKYDFSAGIYLLLLALMTPAQISWLGIVLAGFTAIFFAREVYGGKGCELFHPSLLGCVFLVLSFPETMKETPAWLFSFHSPAESFPTMLAGAAAIFSACWLIFKKGTGWRIPALYLFLIMGLSAMMNILSTLSFAGVFLTAFFFVTDSSCAPSTLPGRYILTAISAVLTLVLDLLSVPWAPAFAVFLTGLFLFWIEEATLPAGIRRGV